MSHARVASSNPVANAGDKGKHDLLRELEPRDVLDVTAQYVQLFTRGFGRHSPGARWRHVLGATGDAPVLPLGAHAVRLPHLALRARTSVASGVLLSGVGDLTQRKWKEARQNGAQGQHFVAARWVQGGRWVAACCTLGYVTYFNGMLCVFQRFYDPFDRGQGQGHLFERPTCMDALSGTTVSLVGYECGGVHVTSGLLRCLSLRDPPTYAAAPGPPPRVRNAPPRILGLGEESPVQAIACAPSTTRCVAVGARACVFDLERGEWTEQVVDKQDAAAAAAAASAAVHVRLCAWHPSASLIALTDDRTIQLWDPRVVARADSGAGAIIEAVRREAVSCFKFSPVNSNIYGVADRSGEVAVYDIRRSSVPLQLWGDLRGVTVQDYEQKRVVFDWHPIVPGLLAVGLYGMLGTSRGNQQSRQPNKDKGPLIKYLSVGGRSMEYRSQYAMDEIGEDRDAAVRSVHEGLHSGHDGRDQEADDVAAAEVGRASAGTTASVPGLLGSVPIEASRSGIQNASITDICYSPHGNLLTAAVIPNKKLGQT